MSSSHSILFFDLEAHPKTREILQIGALRGEDRFVGKKVKDFKTFAAGADILCGHNIMDHDLEVLREKGLPKSFLQKKAIDTLYWSALLFPRKPYHPLVKDYRLAGTELNNPLADARLAQDLLADLLGAFRPLPRSLKTLFFSLLQEAPGFSGFFSLLEAALPAALKPAELAVFYAEHFAALHCGRAGLTDLINAHPVALAYATALLYTDDPDSLPPPWILHRFPELAEVLDQLRVRCDGQGKCAYCDWLSPQKGLKRFFGFDQFRRFDGDSTVPLQEQVVKAALSGSSLLAVFPTGGGKSLTFQLPALMLGAANRSLTVVISPLQSLMKDQVDVLMQRHSITAAVTINGMLSPLERSEALERVQSGGANLLYIAPESLRSNTIFHLLRGRQINRFVIDEAHCFSAWGQDFRVDYLYIAEFIKKLQTAQGRQAPIPVSCFTATAKPAVIKDIRQYFRKNLGLELALFQTHAGRKNLSYYVIKTAGPEEKFEKLVGLLQAEEGPKIVYVARVKTAEALALKLQQYGLPARAYHGQLDRDLKIQIQDEFMRPGSDLEIIVATSAFGMGVDKDNVQLVVHYHISDSLENYMQESGRAGRDPSLRAQCVILFDEDDLNEHFQLLNSTRLNQKEIYQIWQGIKRFRKESFTKSALEIAKQAGWDTEMYQLETRVKTAIAALEDAGYVKREENASRVFAQSIQVKNLEKAYDILENNSRLFEDDQGVETAKRVFSSLLSRARTGKETQVDYMAEHLGLERHTVTHILQTFKHLRILSDDKDLTAYFYPATSKKSSVRVFGEVSAVERSLFDLLFPHPEAREKRFFLRELNEALIGRGVESSLYFIKEVLNFWEIAQVVRKERIDRPTEQYHIQLRVDREEFLRLLEDRILAARSCLQIFQNRYLPLAEADADFPEKKLLRFSLGDVQKQIEEHWPRQHPVRFYEYLLLYLHHIHAIELKSGLLVFYNPMKITRQSDNLRKQYTLEDYAKLDRYYQSRIEQIHIVGEYAQKQLQFYEEAARFADDYFTLPYQQFLDKYFPHNQERLRQPLSEEKFRQLIGNLSAEQLQVIRDNQHDRILVAAGPGSGKTRVLVHKVASLLLLEDVKPEQFLMLTFSRPAALEFKTRLCELVGRTAYYIDIFTFHGFAFQLAGRLGNLERAQNILPSVTRSIQEGALPSDRLRSKSVVVIDEFQDLSEAEYRFLMAIIRQAEKIRILGVGDDDQNIYEFRGAKPAYMQAFAEKSQARIYYLSANYRARPNLLQFTNQYLTAFLGRNRLKKDIELVAQRAENGRIEITTYQSPHLFLPLVADLQKHRLSGTVAVLTHSNEEAVILHSLLRQAGLPVRLLAEQQGFALRDLLEVRTFSYFLLQIEHDELGLITAADWKAAKEKTEALFSGSQNLDLLQRVLQSYAESHPKKFGSTWLAYLRESRIEDFYHPEENVLLVSTMHKVKGKEFDQVFLLLNHYPLVSAEKKRVLYVAMTRARDQLFIHTNNLSFPTRHIPQLAEHRDDRDWPAPDTLTISCGLPDVWLGYFKNPWVAADVKEMCSGDPLFQKENQPAVFRNATGRDLLWLSQSFEKKWLPFLEEGYELAEARVQYIVVWRDPEDGKEHRVILPVLELRRRETEGD